MLALLLYRQKVEPVNRQQLIAPDFLGISDRDGYFLAIDKLKTSKFYQSTPMTAVIVQTYSLSIDLDSEIGISFQRKLFHYGMCSKRAIWGRIIFTI